MRRRRWRSSSARLAARAALLRAVAGGAGDRVLVFARQALHDATRSSFSAWRWRWRRSAAGWRRAAAAAWEPWLLGAGDRHVGRRLRHALRVPGSRVRSRARAALDSGALRRRRVAGHLARSCTSSRSRASPRSAAWRRSAAIYSPASRGVALLLVYEQSLVSEDDLSQVKRAFDLNGYVGILYLAGARRLAIYVRWSRATLRSRSAITGASGALYATRTLAALLEHGCHVELVVSDYGRRLLRDELGDAARDRAADRLPRREVRRGVRQGTYTLYSNRDLGATIASGSQDCEAMVVVPCSMKTLAGDRARPVAQPRRARRRRDAQGAAPAGDRSARNADEPAAAAQHGALRRGRRR